MYFVMCSPVISGIPMSLNRWWKHRQRCPAQRKHFRHNARRVSGIFATSSVGAVFGAREQRTHALFVFHRRRICEYAFANRSSPLHRWCHMTREFENWAKMGLLLLVFHGALLYNHVAICRCDFLTAVPNNRPSRCLMSGCRMPLMRRTSTSERFWGGAVDTRGVRPTCCSTGSRHSSRRPACRVWDITAGFLHGLPVPLYHTTKVTWQLVTVERP